MNPCALVGSVKISVQGVAVWAAYFVGSKRGLPVDTVLGRGIYSLADAAALTDLKRSRIREWFRIRTQKPYRKPLFVSDYDPIDGEFAISFLDLVDVFVVGTLRDHGVTMRTLRRVYERLRRDWKVDHPFCREEIRTDGKDVFLRSTDKEGREELTEVLTRQRVFPEIIAPFLKRIDYDRVALIALRWHIATGVVVDPAICFGKPVAEGAGIPTRILAAAYQANGQDAGLVARWYNIRPEHVLAAARFEGDLAA